jgi:hypothetical protein
VVRTKRCLTPIVTSMLTKGIVTQSAPRDLTNNHKRQETASDDSLLPDAGRRRGRQSRQSPRTEEGCDERLAAVHTASPSRVELGVSTTPAVVGGIFALSGVVLGSLTTALSDGLRALAARRAARRARRRSDALLLLRLAGSNRAQFWGLEQLVLHGALPFPEQHSTRVRESNGYLDALVEAQLDASLAGDFEVATRLKEAQSIGLALVQETDVTVVSRYDLDTWRPIVEHQMAQLDRLDGLADEIARPRR